jgi:ATP-binding cassette subfamily B protein
MAAFLLLGIALQLANPQVIRYFLDTAESGGPARTLSLAAGVFIAFALLQRVFSLVAEYTSQQVSWSATNQLRSDLSLHCLHLDMPFHKRHTPGELIERIDGDVTQLANFFSQFTIRLFGNGLLVLGVLILLVRQDALVGAGMVIYTAVTLVMLAFVQKLATPRWAAARQAIAEQYGFIEERISGVADIRAIGAEAYTMRRLYSLMRAYLEKVRASYVLGAMTYHLTNLIYVVGYASGLALGVYLYLQGRATIGAAYLIVYYVGMLSQPLQAIRQQSEDLGQAAASIERVQELFNLQPMVDDSESQTKSRLGSSPHVLPPGPLSVSFREVSFHYDENENVLHQVSFDLRSGKVLGILGRTGGGKSTLTRLLFRLYDPSLGTILLDGTDIRQVPLAELRQHVGMVTQDVQLFQASLRDNLAFFDERISDERLQRALENLHLWDWVHSTPEGLDTLISAGGGGISAGEAQMLAFARVFLKDPGLVVLDEASSRLDPATETMMERAIDRLFAGRTGVIIAHRLRTVQRADEILILENGRAVEYGPCRDLANDPDSRFSALLRTGLEEALA